MEKAEKARKALQKKGILLEPVIVQKRAIATSWWGKAWAENLERYSDYENRLPRGRSYVRSGAVLDLKITEGTITALVAGSRLKPYSITITITPLDKKHLSALQERSRTSLDSLQLLLTGEFPIDLKNDFFKQTSGLFPSPKEIKLDCTCPDWAEMCKHVAAALYGTAVRLDEKPELFFMLRGVDVNSFIGKAVKEAGRTIAKKAAGKSARTLAVNTGEMEALFGISLETTDNKPEPVIKKTGKTAPKKKPVATKKKETGVKKEPAVKAKTLSKKSGSVKKVSVAVKKNAVKKTVPNKTNAALVKKQAKPVTKKATTTRRVRKDI